MSRVLDVLAILILLWNVFLYSRGRGQAALLVVGAALMIIAMALRAGKKREGRSP